MKFRKCIGAIAGLLCAMVGYTQNPIVQTVYTADPAPMVYKDTVFLYTGHDEDTSTYFRMNDWRVFSSTDMVNWTHRGAPLSYKTFKWSKGDAWAGQCIARNGKFYWYVPVNDSALGRHSIGVAVADHPAGPFKDAIGKPLVAAHWGDIDLTVFIDDDGQAYLYWGNPGLWYVKLNKDMVSYSGEVVAIPLNKEGFAVRTGNPKRTSQYEEAPWFYKRNGLYYMLYAAGGVPEHIAYSTSKNATGPWVYKDTIMTLQGGSFTNHPGIIDYKNNSYFFYHNGALPKGGGFRRSVCVEQFVYNADGTIPGMNMTKGVLKSVKNVDPYQLNEAETIAWEEGIETAIGDATGVYVTDISNGDYIKIRDVDFGKGARSFEAKVAGVGNGGSFEIHLDSVAGELLGTCTINNSGSVQKWITKKCPVKTVAGVHDLYFVFKGEADNLFNFDKWQFRQ